MIYRAFTEASTLASWIPSYDFLCTVHETNMCVDRTYKIHSIISQLATDIDLKEKI